MAKLNQIIAVVNGKKTQQKESLTKLYHTVQKDELFQGISRVYTSVTEDGEVFPSESKNPQFKVADIVKQIKNVTSDFLNVAATQDWTNCNAKADIKVDGQVLVKDCPVTYMMFLEKQIQDIKTTVEAIPVLDPSEEWTFSNEKNTYVSTAKKTTKTKKEPRTHVKYEATQHHPAQTEMYHEDVTVGHWEATKFSGAWPAKQKEETLSRVNQLLEAIKFAREEANGTDAQEVKVADSILDFMFGK